MSFPVRPTETAMSMTSVTSWRGWNLNATAQRGFRERNAELFLLVAAVDFDHDAVDLVVELVAAALQLIVVRDGLVDARAAPSPLRHPEAPVGERLEHLRLRREREGVGGHDLVGEEIERTIRRNGSIELPEGSGGGVSWIGECVLADLRHPAVQFLEVAEPHDHLGADPEGTRSRPLLRRERERERPDRLEVLRHVLARRAVATSRAPQETGVTINELDGQTVELGLRHVLDRLDPELLVHSLRELPHVGLRGDGLEREHGSEMPHLAEGFLHLARDALGRGVGGDEVGVGLLELDELAEKLVIGGIRDPRPFLDVVQAVVLAYLLPEGLDALGVPLVAHEPAPLGSLGPSPPRPNRARSHCSARSFFASTRRQSSGWRAFTLSWKRASHGTSFDSSATAMRRNSTP